MNENNSCTVPSGVGKVSTFNYPIACICDEII